MEYIKGVELREVIDTLNEKGKRSCRYREIGCELADASMLTRLLEETESLSSLFIEISSRPTSL